MKPYDKEDEGNGVVGPVSHVAKQSARTGSQSSNGDNGSQYAKSKAQ
jgi:hypothetical protein